VAEQGKQNILDLPKVAAVGISSPGVALLTSHFGVGGTLVGLAMSSVLITAATDFLKVYLARVPGAVTSIPGGLKTMPRWRQLLYRLRHPFSKFSSLTPSRRHSILIGSLIAGAMAFVVGLLIVTGVEASVGKSLSCWVWDDCPTASSTSDKASSTTTLSSALGGGTNTTSSSNAPQVSPSSPQQQQPIPAPGGAPESSPSQLPNVPGAQTPNSSPSPDQRWSTAGVPEDQQPSADRRQNPASDSSGQQGGNPAPQEPQGGSNE
jgi:hypothetical protein